VWIRRGDLWRRARVLYPRHVPPGWGFPPALAAGASAVGIASTISLLVVAARSGAWDPEPFFSHDVARVVGAAKPAIVAAAVIVLALSLWELVAAGRDLRAGPRRLTGVVVGRWAREPRWWNPWGDFVPRHWYVAVDDGASRAILGWRVSEGCFRAVRDGELVDAVVTPHLRTVTWLAHHTTAPPPTPADAHRRRPSRRARRRRHRGAAD
jgi:hypothetical protein